MSFEEGFSVGNQSFFAILLSQLIPKEFVVVALGRQNNPDRWLLKIATMALKLATYCVWSDYSLIEVTVFVKILLMTACQVSPQPGYCHFSTNLFLILR